MSQTQTSDRLYVYCHRCENRLGVALSDPEARSIADGHEHEDVSWDPEPVGENAGIETVVERIRQLADEIDDPDGWRVLIPDGMFDEVVSKLDTTEDLGKHYRGISLCYTTRDFSTKVEYHARLKDHIQSNHD